MEFRPPQELPAATVDERGSAYRSNPVASSQDGGKGTSLGQSSGYNNPVASVGRSVGGGGVNRCGPDPTMHRKKTKKTPRKEPKRQKTHHKTPPKFLQKKTPKMHFHASLLGGKMRWLKLAEFFPVFYMGKWIQPKTA